MGEKVEEPGTYRVKAAHMRRLADQSHDNFARTAYLSLEASWLRLEQRAAELRARLWDDSANDPQDGEPA